MIRKFALSLALVGGAVGTFASSAALAQVQFDAIAPSIATDKPLNDLFSRQWVKLDDSGRIEGQIVELLKDDKLPIDGVPISLVRDGKIVSTVNADSLGKFAFVGIQPGLYSLVSRTNQTIAAFALQVLDGKDASHLSNSIEVRAIRSVSDKGEKVKEIIRSQIMPSQIANYSDTLAATFDPLAAERRFAVSHVVKLNSNGSLKGQLAKSGIASQSSGIEGTTVFVLKDDEQVARTEVNANGVFTIEGLKEGIYGFIAAGAGNFVATSFQVVDPALAKTAPDGRRLVSMNLADCCPSLNCEVVDSHAVSLCDPVITETVIAPPIVESCAPPIADVAIDQCGCGVAPSCGGGCGCGGWGGGGGGYAGGGGYGGGGGGGGLGGLLGGGGGGFGGIAGLAGLAGIAAVTANNDSGGTVSLNQPAVTVSPIVR